MRLPALFLACALAACASHDPTPLTPVAVASPQEACRMPWDVFYGVVQRRHVELIEVTDLAYFLKGFNALPPQSDFTADRIFVAHLGEAARVLFVTDGCLEKMAEISWGDAVALMGEGI